MGARVSRLTRLALLSGLVVVPISLRAQDAAPSFKNLLSLNPLGIPFEYISAEWERVASGITSFGLTGSYLGFESASYSTLEAKVRFYPNEEAPKGFSVGLAGGITRVSEDFISEADESETRPTIAVIIDYNWLLGKNKRFVVGAGVGAKRILGTSGDYSDVSVAYPTARFQIGLRY
ncbi:MAG: hypothetical protein ACT4P7_09320 [Gemmatimonadaceae bacterium]